MTERERIYALERLDVVARVLVVRFVPSMFGNFGRRCFEYCFSNWKVVALCLFRGPLYRVVPKVNVSLLDQRCGLIEFLDLLFVEKTWRRHV